jgi:Tfp pilus assembly protein PilN
MININLLEKKSRIEIFFSYFNFFILEIFILILVLAGIIVTMFLINKNLNLQNTIISREIDALSGFLRPLQRRNAEIIKNNKDINELLDKINSVIKIKNRTSIYYKLFMELEKLTPDDCWISNLRYKGDNNLVQLRVNALRTSSVNMFVNNLTMNTLFSNVRLQRVSSEMEKEFNVNAFIIYFSIKEETD